MSKEELNKYDIEKKDERVQGRNSMLRDMHNRMDSRRMCSAGEVYGRVKKINLDNSYYNILFNI